MRDSEARSRAEQVRKRRKQEAGKRLSNSAVLATRPVAPITARGSMLQGGPSRGRPVARRRGEKSLSMPGIEVRMPTISFSGPGAKWRFMSFGVSLLLGAAVYLAITAPAFKASAVQVIGNQRITSEEIGAILATGETPIFMLVPAELEKRLRLNFPDLLAANVSVGLPNEVYVDIVERTPILAWYQGGGYTWIDESGVAFRPRGEAANLITVRAENAPKPVTVAVADPVAPLPYISPELVAAARELAPHAPAGAAIIYDAEYGFGWADSRGWQVFFGEQARDAQLKLRVYDSLVQMVAAKGIQPSFINVQYPSAPYYRMSQ
jgi:hypothetical protein